MTLKSLLNWSGTHGKGYQLPMERYHGGGGPWEHKSHGHGHHKGGGGGGKGTGAALSALTLLAFLFLLHVMQQSLYNHEQLATTTTTAFLLRDDPVIFDAKEQRIALKSPNEKDRKEPRVFDSAEDDKQVDGFQKGDTLG